MNDVTVITINLDFLIILGILLAIDLILNVFILYLKYKNRNRNYGGFTPGEKPEPEELIVVKKESVPNRESSPVSMYMGNDFEKKAQCIKSLAKEAGWIEIKGNDCPPTLSFMRKKERINVWYTTMTVSTAINHPVKGKTQLYRHKISMKILKQLFENPRMHTNKGYFNKRERPYRK